MNPSEDFKISKNLVGELEKQAQVLYEYSIALAKVKTLIDKKKQNIIIMESELRHVIPRDIKTYAPDLPKITEKALDALVQKQPEMITLRDEEVNLNEEKYELESAVKAMDHKKYALQDLTKLRLAEINVEVNN